MNGCMSAFICSVYHVSKDLLFDQYRIWVTAIKFKFAYTSECVFFMFGVVCDFVCEVSLEGVVVMYSMLYSSFFFNLLGIFCMDLL